MASGRFSFEGFSLDPANRRLVRGGEPLELGGRYFDALELLVSEAGRLVTKDRFMDEVWKGVPVTDEALTQCIRTLRRLLGDDSARPRFIETVPKHGYRFIAPVEAEGAPTTPQPPSPSPRGRVRRIAPTVAAGTAGGAFAGLLGGLFYGFAAAGSAIGSASAVLVLVSVTVIVASLGAAGVAAGIALAGPKSPWAILSGGAGGLVVGAIVKLLGQDAFALLLGRSPGDVTGAMEGALIGAAIGLGAWLSARFSLAAERAAVAGALAGGAAGLLAPLLGGRMMAGSLDLLQQSFPGSRLQIDQLGAMVGEKGFGPVAQLVTGGVEGALFGGCVVAAIAAARTKAARSPG